MNERLRSMDNNPKNNTELSRLLFPVEVKDLQEYESIYPPRSLPWGAMVTRFAPSPTGFPHIGSVYSALISSLLAEQTKGVSILRIEDTDKKREVTSGVEEILSLVNSYNIKFTEGNTSLNNTEGVYGPYIQSLRYDIYLSAAKELLERGFAYPCFCSEEELTNLRAEQEKAKVKSGYYGKWAKCRSLSKDQIQDLVKSGTSYVIRFKAPEDNSRVRNHDMIKGDVYLPANDQDIVLIKANLGLPTYHLAHIVDDHFMRTTHVVRGEEWFSSLPLHLQLFQAFGWESPTYAHFAPILKKEDGSKRKLSKRKDPEASAKYYIEHGIPVTAVKAYLLNLANSNFEEWRRSNPQEPLSKFSFSLEKMASSSGAILDIVKLVDISKEEISWMVGEEIYDQVLEWAKSYRPDFYKIISRQKEYTIKILNIERNQEQRRKDIAKWSEVPETIGYFYDELFHCPFSYETENITSREQILSVLESIREAYDGADDRETWLAKIKTICVQQGCATSLKEYKVDTAMHKGHLGDVTMILRLALTGSTKSPDLYQVMSVMGEERVKRRLNMKQDNM